MKKIAVLWEPFGDPVDKKVRCKVCSHYCIIGLGKRGFCKTRENIDGKLYTLVYGAAIHRGSNDPIEKKPLYHFWPGSMAFSIATVGCNFRCKHCQNWEISQSFPNESGRMAEFSPQDQNLAQSFPLTEITPESVIKAAKRLGSQSIAYTYNEPTIWFEFIKDTAILAKKEGIFNILVTNGYSSPEANEELVQFIDAANVDIKGFSDNFYKRVVGVPSLQPVLDTCRYLKNHGIHLEVTTLLIPNENDNTDELKGLVDWIAQNLGKDTPVHFSAYHPDYRLDQPRTSASLLLKAYDLAQGAGINYIFIGNVQSKQGNNSYCPKCHAILIERFGYSIKYVSLDVKGICQKCGQKSDIVGKC